MIYVDIGEIYLQRWRPGYKRLFTEATISRQNRHSPLQTHDNSHTSDKKYSYYVVRFKVRDGSITLILPKDD